MLANEGHDNWITVTVLLARMAGEIAAEIGGVSLTQYRALTRLQANGGELTSKELGQNLGLSPSTVTGAVSSLQSKGAVTRRDDGDDLRVVHVILLDGGRALLAKVDPAIAELAHDFWSVYTHEELSMTRRDSESTVLKRRLGHMVDGRMSIENAYVDSALVTLGALNRHMKRENISLNEYRVLHLLSRSPQGMRPRDIARELFLRSSEVTVAAGKLAGHGRIERVRVPGDRRAAALRILDAGYAKLEHMTPGIVETLRRDITDLDDNAFEVYDNIASKILDRYRRDHLVL